MNSNVDSLNQFLLFHRNCSLVLLQTVKNKSSCNIVAWCLRKSMYATAVIFQHSRRTLHANGLITLERNWKRAKSGELSLRSRKKKKRKNRSSSRSSCKAKTYCVRRGLFWRYPRRNFDLASCQSLMVARCVFESSVERFGLESEGKTRRWYR